ncbi:MAG TPA: APC family permease [Rhizomicrobium sp.]|nr:APC family permease [Rhizomicrobium sp.]
MTIATIAAAPARGHLLKILGVTFGVAVAIGQIIGSGILRAPSAIAGEVPGIALILGLWTLGAVQVWLAANLNAELGAALPRTGGGYNYVRRAMGDVFGLVVGWTDALANMAGAAAASVSFAEFLPLLVPAAATHKIAVALSLQLALYAANITGLREGRALQELTSFIKAAMLLVFILVAVVLLAPQEPKTVLSSPVAFQWANMILAYQLIMGAYAGWNTPLAFAGENEAPEKSIPRALFLGILLTAVLYVGVNWALLHALSPAGVAASPLPFSVILRQIGGGIPGTLFALTALITVASCSNACIMTAPRILFALGHDRLLPHAVTRVNMGGSPTVAYLMTAAGTLALAASGTFALVFGLIATLNAASGFLVDIAYWVLRMKEPQLPRPFRAIGYPVLPAIPVLVDAALVVLFTTADYVGGLVAVGLGLLCIPFAYVAHRARRAAAAVV